ncbi:non-hydrolyzing UDP-N-acetylglucosamine 2-epimerase [Halobacterium zhouii]|uniref:non-hydrolyzing UDP-N-acetylglucosamine 2-epimerase n=1 Tax=Halobacterium zhouii TaxID=2902624 RepID=UPI001E395A24|nr:UDP-N-acetylglucosamine 2-epimerase (non-hydrolyzing) [Halobacterium zhouii]
MKVASVVGARPQFVKAAPVSRALAAAGHEELLVHTGQHYDDMMSGVFFEELDIDEPAYNLDVGSDSHGRQTGRMLERFEAVVEDEDPDVVLVYGDTNSTLAGAVVAAKRDVTLANVESGLRSFEQSEPEEVNRVLAEQVSDVLFAPTDSAVENLARENVTGDVHQVGDVMLDVMLWARDVARDRSTVLDDLGLTDGEYALATVHRAQNTDDSDVLADVMTGLVEAPVEVVLPLHPRTEERLREYGFYDDVESGLTLVDPLGYFDFVRALEGASRVATDSGGVQKEAFFLDTRCVTLREETEWVETVEAGWNTLVGSDPDAIVRELGTDDVPDEKPDLFGDGTAAERIAAVLSEGDTAASVEERSPVRSTDGGTPE